MIIVFVPVSTDYEARYYDNSKKQLGYAPDLTSTVAIMNPTPPSLNSDYSYGDPNSNKTGVSTGVGLREGVCLSGSVPCGTVVHRWHGERKNVEC